MSMVEKIQSELTNLKPEYQTEVLDFVEFLKRKQDRNVERAFQEFSLSSAMRGMEDEPDLYTEEDIREPVR